MSDTPISNDIKEIIISEKTLSSAAENWPLRLKLIMKTMELPRLSSDC